MKSVEAYTAFFLLAIASMSFLPLEDRAGVDLWRGAVISYEFIDRKGQTIGFERYENECALYAQGDSSREFGGEVVALMYEECAANEIRALVYLRNPARRAPASKGRFPLYGEDGAPYAFEED